MTTQAEAPSGAKKTYLGTATTVMAAFVLSRVLGLVRDSLLGSTFGAGAELDAYTAAARVTETLYYLVAGGALASAFVPTFTAYLARDERKTAWQVASAWWCATWRRSAMACASRRYRTTGPPGRSDVCR